jgi:hypothetical protein
MICLMHIINYLIKYGCYFHLLWSMYGDGCNYISNLQLDLDESLRKINTLNKRMHETLLNELKNRDNASIGKRICV